MTISALIDHGLSCCIRRAANAAADAAVAEALKEMRLTAAQADMTSEDSIADEEAALAAALDAELKRELAAMAAKALSETSAPPAERPRNLSTRKLVGSGSILTAANEDAIRGMMPAFLQDETLTLVYSLLLHGSDMTSFFSCTKNYQYTIAVVQATTGEVFGGFNAVSWKHSPSYYGSGESFVFKLSECLIDLSPIITRHVIRNDLSMFMLYICVYSCRGRRDGSGVQVDAEEQLRHVERPVEPCHGGRGQGVRIRAQR